MPPNANPRSSRYQLQVNAYDRTATLVVALLVMVGLTVFGLAVVFFTNRVITVVEPIPVVPVEATSANPNQGLAEEPDPPGIEDAPDLSEPSLQDTLDVLMDQSLNEALFSDEAVDALKEAGKGKGLGDARMAGEGGDGVVERVPRWQRWSIRFEPKSLTDFGAWLDHNKIEIGVLGRDNQVHYAYEFSKGVPKTRAGAPKADQRGYTSAADGPMPTLTNALARKADVTKHGSIVLLFYPKAVEDLLWTIEQKHADGRDVNSIRQTVFTVEREGSGYQFKVLSQKYF